MLLFEMIFQNGAFLLLHRTVFQHFASLPVRSFVFSQHTLAMCFLRSNTAHDQSQQARRDHAPGRAFVRPNTKRPDVVVARRENSEAAALARRDLARDNNTDVCRSKTNRQ